MSDLTARDADEAAAKPALRLRTLLTVPFVLLILAPAIIIAGSFLYTGLKAVDLLSRQLMDDISARVGQAAVHQLEEAAVTLRAVFPAVDDNQNASVDLFSDTERLERKLFELTAAARTTSYLYFGREDGSFIGVDRGAPGAKSSATVRLQQSGGVPRAIYTARSPGDRTRLVETETRVYDARERVWYQLAKSSLKLTWTPVYVSFASGALVATAAQPVLAANGKFHGVLAADVELSELSNFMKSVTVSANGVAFIVDRDGMLVATSTPEQPFRLLDGVQQRVAARNSQSSLVRAAAQWWRNDGRNVRASVAIATVNTTGEPVDVASRRVSGIDGVDWDIVVAVPRSDFTASIVNSAISMFFVVLVALAAALTLGLWVLRRVTRDVDQVVNATRDTSAGGLPATMPQTTLAETGVLAQAFREMVRRLQQSLATIRTQNDQLALLNATLEERVEQRTTQLAEQNLTLTEEIVRRERLERDLRNTSNAAQKAGEDKARFLAILSHELRTPLQAVVGASQLLSSRRLPDGSATEVATLDAAAKSLLTLIDGVLSYSRLEAGVVTPVLKTFELRECIDEAVRVAKAAYARPDVALAIELDSGVPTTVHTDQGMLRQVLINLLANALKFTQRGSVTVSVSSDSDDDERSDHPFLLRFVVRDTGTGIDAGTQQRLFQPFQQGLVAGSAPGVGSGLGLVICSLLVRALGGEIGMLSRAGEGTQMTFTVRAQTPPSVRLPVGGSSGGTTPEIAIAEQVSHLSVLVVEDNDVNRELLGIMLGQLGHRVTAAADGEQAVALCEAQAFDVVLMDLNLPRIGGIEATRRILHGPATQKEAGRMPAIVALTASVSDADRALCTAAGMRGFLSKPATVFSLDVALREAMRGQTTPEELTVTDELIDLPTLSSLAELEAKAAEPFVERLIARFLQGSPGEVQRIREYWDSGDRAQCIARAHALAGGAAAVGALALARAARRVNDAPDEASVMQVEAVESETQRALHEWIAETYPK
ncbi:MAG: response regulator [Burkholderiales bacterium]|nr:response regulator [Burkholderiales bacterium]